jgi:sugar lactone lactonase YvrE
MKRSGLWTALTAGAALVGADLACSGGGGGGQVTPPPSNPTITSFTAGASQIFRGETSQLTGVFANGTAKIGTSGSGSTQVTAGATSGAPYPVSPQATTTYTLTVANSANASITADATVNVETSPPSITFFSTPAAVVPWGSTATLSWQLGARTSTLTLNGGSVQGQTSVNVTPLRRSTYTLVARNPLGADATQSLTVAARGQDLLAGTAETTGYLDGKGSAARFGASLWFGVHDGAGNLVVVDSGNHVIRKIAPDGVVSTLAGTPMVLGNADGPGSSAKFKNPTGIAIDKNGTMYVADSGNHTIRQLTPAGVVTTIAGTPGISGHQDGPASSATFGNLMGMDVDGNGTIYIADQNGCVIRVLSSNGAVSTLAGSPGVSGKADGAGSAARFSNLTDVALAGGYLFVSDTGNNTIRRVVIATGLVSTFAGQAGVTGQADGTGAGATFSQPLGLELGPDGNLYLADSVNARIRRINPTTAEVGTLAGTTPSYADGPLATAGFNGPAMVVAMADGSFFTSDGTFGTIRRIAGGQVSTLAGVYGGGPTTERDGSFLEARFLGINGLGFDNQGALLIADSDAHAIRKAVGGAVTTLAGGVNGQGSADGTGQAARFRFPYGSTFGFDSANAAYVGDSSNQTVRKVTPEGIVTTLAGSAGAVGAVDDLGAAARFNNPHGTAVDGAGNIYLADTGNHAIRRITPAGSVTTFAGLKGTWGEIDGAGSAARFKGPTGLVRDAAGNFYVTDFYGHTIRKITPDGVVSTLAGSGNPGDADGTGAAASFKNPHGLAVDSSGNVFVADYGNHLIRMISPGGVVTTLAGTRGLAANGTGPLPSILYLPRAVAVSPQGDLVVASLFGLMLITAP